MLTFQSAGIEATLRTMKANEFSNGNDVLSATCQSAVKLQNIYIRNTVDSDTLAQIFLHLRVVG